MLQNKSLKCLTVTMRKLNIFYFFAIILAVLTQNITAQQTVIHQRIKMNTETDKNAIRLSTLKINVDVIGNIATTTYDMTFSNSSNRVLEGEFEFPLDNGQTVSRYALDINGKLREGVVVEKEKGRQVFETIVRQKIDPGLVEMTSGNNFKTRVYPIPANGSRRVVIAYEHELKIIDEKRTYILQPLTSEAVDVFEFSINVYNSSIKNTNEKSSSFDTLDFENWNDSYNATVKKENYIQTKPLSFTLPSTKTGDTYIQTVGTDTYFYYYAPHNIYTPHTAETKNKKLPTNITVFYDISSSTEKRDRTREIALLEKYISLCNPKIIKVVTFSNDIHEEKIFNSNSISKIKEYLENQKYDGSTNFDSLDFDSYAAKTDEILLFSDGMNTWGKTISFSEKSKKFNSSVPVITINSCYSANHSLLSMLAAKNNGVYVNLCRNTNEESINMITKETFRLLNIEYDNTKFDNVYPEKHAVVNDTFSMAGILKKKNGTITLSFGYGTNVTERINVDISSINGIEATNVQRIWAQKKIENLSVFYDDNKTEITELSKKFNIVTKDTSLIVLDNVSDYIRYDITPPEELKDEYNKLIRSNPKQETENTIPTSVYKTFEKFKEWWNTSLKEFKTKKSKKPQDEISIRNQTFSNAASESIDSEIIITQSASSARFAESAPVSNYNESTPNMIMPKSKSNSSNQQIISVELQTWTPDNEYLKKLKKTALEDMYDTYLQLKTSYSSSPAFFIEVSDYFFDENLEKEAYRILSNLAEIETENSDILRALGNKLVEHKDYKNAIWVFEKLTKIRSEIPQFFRDLAMAYHYNGENQKAVDTLWYLASKGWDSRFEEVQQIALNDMNSIIALNNKNKLDTSFIDKKLMENFPVDIRIVLTWNTDNCDIDLWVTDPDNEKCYYKNKLTANGGRISRDFTRGYGPEEFCIKEAPEGTYKIEANYYGTSSQKMLQPVIVQAEIFTNFGRTNQKREVLTLQLDSVKGVFTIGTVTFKK
jgi:hypothetical protein